MERARGAGVAGSGDPAWRSPYGFDFVHVLIVADVGVWGGAEAYVVYLRVSLVRTGCVSPWV